jgi:hypothetical protein
MREIAEHAGVERTTLNSSLKRAKASTETA